MVMALAIFDLSIKIVVAGLAATLILMLLGAVK